MDRWILKQLRAQVLSDLQDYIEGGYFEENIEQFKLSDTINSHKYLSSELHWGHQAAKLGKILNFEKYRGLSPRQIAASEVLMNIGMLAAADAVLAVCEYLSMRADALKVDDGNSRFVARQLKNEQIPVLEENVVGALGQYLKYLKAEDAAPFWDLTKHGDDMKNSDSQNSNLNTPDIESKVQYIMNVNGTIHGDIQQGQDNSKSYQLLDNVKEGGKVMNFLSKHVGKIITTVIAGVILAFILVALGIKP